MTPEDRAALDRAIGCVVALTISLILWGVIFGGALLILEALL